MKRLKNVLLLALLALTPPAARAENGVVLQLKDGSSVGFAFKKRPVIIMGQELQMKTNDGNTIAYPYKEVKCFYWGDVTVTAIDTPKENERKALSFRTAANGITVLGLLKGQQAAIYDLKGQRLASAQAAYDNEPVVLSCPSSARVLIVRTSTGISYKILKH